ncbi:thiamine pyrophosphate-binding protein [Tsuneonella flava]|uniref:thiamine pyrophosphate-binding protein n=1 Tax=Tsuneonella flava TaxID=2055955 RepID=UPI000C807431|nr:thiamine pyrophosphate-binding protein [Tsuneonella flava]
MANIADYLVRRLQENGVKVLFGIPGTSCAKVFESAISAGLRTIVNSSELDAGYAADGYARLRGLGAVSVSYGVGTLSLINAVAGAFVERSPVVVINGGPGAKDIAYERQYGILFSHSTGRHLTDLAAFRDVTAFAVRIEHAGEAASAIDHAVTVAMREKRPVYIEIPQDLWTAECSVRNNALDPSRNPTGLEEEIAAAVQDRLSAAQKPAVLVGAEVARYGLYKSAEQFLAHSGLPWASTLLAKTVIPEDTAGFVGVYDSDLAPKPVREVIESSDCLITLGCVFGIDHTLLVRDSFDKMIAVGDGLARFGAEVPRRAELGPVLENLAKGNYSSAPRPADIDPVGDYAERRSWVEQESPTELTHEQLYSTIDSHLSEDWQIVHDTCLGSYPSADLKMPGRNAFMCCPVWLSIGHSIGAAVGAGLADARRPLVICGDGGFQITGQGLSAMVRAGIEAVVIVIDNGMYAIEQYLIDASWYRDPDRDPLPYVGLNRWDYTGFAKSMGVSHTETVSTPEELAAALTAAEDWKGVGLISARVSARDLPPENS